MTKKQTAAVDGAKGGGEAAAKSDVALREEAVLAFWQEHDIFKKSLEKDAPNGDYVFYDGPPFATGLPHYGHILAGTIKDTIPRFWTMRGYRVERKWGWDCHGLPLENLIEKKLGLATKRDIEALGVQTFNEAARDAVMEFADDWRRIIPRMGRFVDMEDDYKTMDSSYTEGVWWVFSELYKKGFVYEGFKSMHLCPRCGTTLSNFEVNQGYQDIKDIAVTVKLPLLDDEGNKTNESLLVWTTTPWTLPGNMAAAVHNDYEYAKVKVVDEYGNEEVVILAKERMAQLALPGEKAEDSNHEVIAVLKGSELVGRRYLPPFDYVAGEDFEHKENAWQILHADYVEIGEEGTGAVHLAPAYGDDDMQLAKDHNVPIVHHVDADGRFLPFVTDFAGQLVKPKDDDDAGVTHLEADIEIVKALKASGRLYKKENITHSYPHCWRCDTPLLNYATTSWFVEVTKITDQLVKENSDVHWVPEHVGRARFGKWLEGARDWAVSRQRYWGAPLPVWRNPETKDIHVMGSLADMRSFVKKSGNTYHLMRHGEATSNVAGIVSAQRETKDPLTEKGEEQVAQSAAELKDAKIDLIICSPFQRTKETAQIAARELGLSEADIIEDEAIVELQLDKEHEGTDWSIYRQNFPDFAERFTKSIAGFENYRSVQVRAGEFLERIEVEYQGKNILIVGHQASLFGLETAAAGMTPKESGEHRDSGGYFDNAQVRVMSYFPYPRNDHFELDFHRPYIDDFDLFDGETKLERVPDVFDCWFESGSMPYAQDGYTTENTELHAATEGARFPADFIAESIDQTRGWFYSLMVLGVALFGKSPFKNVITNGLVLAEDGKKMSKKLQNYPDPMYLADTTGSDTMRFYLLSSPIIKGEDLNFSEKEVQELGRKNIGRLHNVLSFYELFADSDGTRVAATADSDDVLDRWILARLSELVTQVTAGYEQYELDRATRPITEFIDDLSVWYVRRSRDRIKAGGAPAALALGTLRHVLLETAKVVAPVMPFYAEHLYRALQHDTDPESVHLCDWPMMTEIPEKNESDDKLLFAMNDLRSVVSSALDMRVKAGMKVRQPLASVKLSGELVFSNDDGMIEIIKDELNVKEVLFTEQSIDAVTLDTALTPELQAEGSARDLIRGIQDLRKKAGLAPSDSIKLHIQADDAGAAVVTQFGAEIKSVVGAEAIDMAAVGDGGTEIKTDQHTFMVAIV